MSYADAMGASRPRKLGLKVEVKVEKRGPTPPDSEDRRPWWRRSWDAIRNFIKIDIR
ncbi:hypothetical protein [Roseomonas sp. KE2513]|uniref:hypothetical protein n=1 Tax=Roseomonas sp. KE2513 TaxID=2479202 RepID=UPI0018DF1D6D|nr:hypothetical protein [Roseomonas sp. KE2513]